jgi:hypothetical protein
VALTPKFSPINEDATAKGRRWSRLGQYKYALGKLTFTDGDVYTTGGFGIEGAQVGTTGVSGKFSNLLEAGLGIRTIEHLEFNGVSTTSTGNLSGALYAVWDYTNKVVKLIQIGRATDNTKPAPDAEITNGALLTGVTLPFIVIGT